jgi:hypothetical protein
LHEELARQKRRVPFAVYATTAILSSGRYKERRLWVNLIESTAAKMVLTRFIGRIGRMWLLFLPGEFQEGRYKN